MPFTLSHPAIAVPLARRGLVLSALVVGSMAPDFQYPINQSFGSFPLTDRMGHSLPGIFLFCLPVGLVVLGLFHYLLKLPLISLFPLSHQQRLLPVARRFQCRNIRQLVMIMLSLVIGTITHIGWDSFTHLHGWGVRHWPVLNTSVVHVPGFNIKVYMLLQHGGSVGGLLFLLYCYVRWFRQAPVEPVDNTLQLAPRLKFGLLCVMLAIACISAAKYGLTHTPDVTGFFWFQRFLRYTVIGGMSVVYIELLLFSIAWHLWRPRKTLSRH